MQRVLGKGHVGTEAYTGHVHSEACIITSSFRYNPASMRLDKVHVWLGLTNLRNTLLVLPSVESGPGDPTRVLALKEQAFGLAILESEDLAVAANVELSLLIPSAIVQYNRLESAASSSSQALVMPLQGFRV